ncbi:MAG TPA: TonB-dependent receptor [Thermoanaerobaculia bacterium]|nr:TonB-dependent receptor [Thermoanaerobaculia bacterium]
MNRFASGLALLLLLFSTAVVAQEQTSSIEGTTMDQSGAALPGVTVEALSNKGVRYTATTDGSGRFRFPSIQPGIYTVTATLAGMEPAVAKNLEARLGESPKVDMRLRVGAVTEAMTVTAEAPLVDVTSSAAQTSIRSETFEQLPRGRDFSSVVTFAPSANVNNKTGGISIDGASGSENRYIMDGVDTTNPQTGVQGKTLVTEFVDEVQVKTGGYQAEFGGATGGVINVVTKTGTNELRGSVGIDYSDANWLSGSGAYYDPTNVQMTRGPILLLAPGSTTQYTQFTPREDSRTLSEPEFTIGGPLLRDRIWFFGGYKPWQQTVDRTVTFTSTGTTRTYSQDFTRNNWVGSLNGAVGSKFLWKATYNNSGYEQENLLPAASGRTGNENTDFSPDAELANWTGSGYADFVPTPNWYISGRGGRFFRNFTESGISADPRIVFANSLSATTFPSANIPSSLFRAGGFNSIPTNSASQRDAYIRDNLNLDASWYPNFAGTHRFKAGVQYDKIKNEVLRGQQNYLVQPFWGQVCDFCNGKGTYGSAAVYTFQTTGNVEEKVNGVFLQDSWTTLQDRLTLNLGVRSESEKVPAYNLGTGVPITGQYAINFDYKDKLAPRLGASYDLFGNGRSKAYASYGVFYDITKLEMPRGSFGGDKWIYWGFNIEDPDWTKWQNGGCQNVTNNPSIKPTCNGMVLNTPGGVDLRHPSNASDLPLVDPNLQPMESREYSLGFQQELTNTLAGGFRYVNKHLVRTIEDVGVHVFFDDGSEAEEFFIANPGEGVAQKILEAAGCASCPAMPKAKRDYEGFEFELTKRFSNRWSAHASYLYSRLRGNYSGLANSDEVTTTPGSARTSPNVNRSFDSLFMLFNQEGQALEGPLGGDRPHQAKAQVAYEAPWGTTVGVSEYYYSGTPTTTEMRFQGAPIFPFGRNDMGRTPAITQTDLNIAHTFRIGRFGLQVGGIVLNLFDEKKATNIYPIWSTTSILLRDPGCADEGSTSKCIIGGSTAGSARNAAQAAAFFKGFDAAAQRARQVALGLTPDPRYGQPNTYQDPREVRLFARFTF